MTCRIVGEGCVQGPECNPKYPARPVAFFGYCFFCWGNLGEEARASARAKFASDLLVESRSLTTDDRVEI